MDRTVLAFLTPLLLVGIFITFQKQASSHGTRQDRSERWTTWHGIYTQSQADNGWENYGSACARCHGENLDGGTAPPIVGDRFIENWREDTLDNLFKKISEMPPQGPRLNYESYLNILGYILQENKYPPGPYQLTIDTLETVWIEGVNGRQPVPDRAVVKVVGCLSQTDGKWVLTNATEPVRTHNPESTNPDELKAAESEIYGGYEFLLTNFYMLGGFDPAQYEGNRMLAKGALNKNLNGDKISLTSLEMVSAGCR